MSTATYSRNPAEAPAGDRSIRTTLWQRYNGSERGSSAEEDLIKEYLPLVKTVVGRVAISLPAHVQKEDLHSAGLVGLLSAARNYNPACGTTFETYARIRIRGAVFDELRRLDWVPRSVHFKARKIQGVIEELEQVQGKPPADHEIATALNISMQEYRQWLDEIKPATFVCLDAVPNGHDEEGLSQAERIADENVSGPDEDVSKREMIRLIGGRLEQLPEKHRQVIALYYFEDLRLREIAEVFGVTESRICQIHAEAILALKSFIQKQDSVSA